VYTSRPGVAVQINAFNFPVWGMLEKLAPAFLAGLPTIVKPASQTAYLTELAVRRILEAGLLPDGALQLLCGSPAGLLEELRAQDSVAFTGSAHTGAHLRQHPSVLHGGVQLGVEADSLNCSVLGPDVTSSDPEFDLFVKAVVTEMTVKAGQKCTAIRRTIVPAGIADTVTEAIAARLARVTVGNPHPRGRPDGSARLARPARGGAQGRAGPPRVRGDRLRRPRHRRRRGQPTPSAARSCRQSCCGPQRAPARPHDVEPFGPVSTVMTYTDLDQAVALAARGSGSLVGSLVTHDPSVARTVTLGSPRGTAASWSSTATTPPSRRDTDPRCRCWCTAVPVVPAAARSSAVSVACCTTCSAPPSRPRRTC
jgi:oxepin-CoA hydrolase/3-oxo-5,6-dehydrosuberyl-CoA semialdehyde dehydrogenase